MAETADVAVDTIRALLAQADLREWFTAQRWYASRSRSVSSIELFDVVTVGEQGTMLLAIVQAHFASGAHQLYQLPLGVRTGDHADQPIVIAQARGWSAHDALRDPVLAAALMAKINAGGDIETAQGRYSFRCVEGAPGLDETGAQAVRPLDVEQSHTSLVFSERTVLKVFRRLEPGINPELEMLRFLTAHGFEQVARLHGFYEYNGVALASTLGLAQEFIAGAVGGWELALEEIRTGPEAFLRRLAGLGEVTAAMHNTLATDAADPAFSPEEPSHEWIALLTATIDEEIERLFLQLPSNEGLAPIVGRGEDVREQLATRAQIGLKGRMIRTHGDYHLGQTLHSPRGWVVIDFEGEPARPLSDRRLKRSALRDVAGMLRSFAYLSATAGLTGDSLAPGDFENRARATFLDAYLSHVDPSLMPAGELATENLLSIFELERAIYELHYEVEHRPDWVPIPVAGISRLLESS